ncbi:MAG TPA: hypothetical protein PK684_02605 [Bacillota bacterium]|jgi:hypothetical protein|nr:hypothetical protein [Bacillota bacterium]
MESKVNEMCEKCHYRIAAEKNKSLDLGQLLKLAMMVSNMFGQKSENKPQAQPDTAEKKQGTFIPHTPVFSMDALCENKTIRIIKASLPYLDPTYRQLMHVLAKCMELKNIINPELYFSRTPLTLGHRPSAVGMLSAIRPHLEPDEQAAITIAGKALEMVEIFRMMDTKNIDAQKSPPSFENIGQKTGEV